MFDIEVLLVDDNPDLLEVICINLRTAGLTVETAASGEEALAMLRDFRPEVIVSDVSMPGMNGHEFCAKVRELGFTDVPFIFLSVLGDPEHRVLGLRAGADDYVSKSAEPEELILRIRRQIEKHRQLGMMKELAEIRSPFGVMNGTLGEISVPELLQMIGAFALEHVCLHLETSDRKTGDVYLSGGNILHATADGAVGEKALQRMLSWNTGHFRLRRRRHEGPDTMSSPIEKCLLEGMVVLDQYQRLSADLGSGRPLAVDPSAQLFARQFEEETAYILALIADYKNLDAVLEHSSLPDSVTLGVVDELLDLGLIGRSAPRLT